jgi:isopenicillin-N epimerase
MSPIVSLDFSRRNLLAGLAVGGAAVALPLRASANAPAAIPAKPAIPLPSLAQDEAYWAEVRRLYTVTPDITNFENGYFGIMADPVRAQYHALIDRVNTENSYYMRLKLGADLSAVGEALAAAVGAKTSEIALTRGATEALQNLIVNYNRLAPGDSVMYADLDYDSMQYAMEFLRTRRGVEVVKIALPEPATRQAVLDAYDQALKANPKTKLLLLTHISHRTGLVVPVAEIAEMARARGADVIVDAAHSWGQMDFKVADLKADFVGFNLHKWIGAPLGTGFLYIRQERLDAIDPHYSDGDFPKTDIRARVHTGTGNTANWLAIPKALEVHQAIGAAAKSARLRYLRDYWVSRVRDLPGLQILTPDEPGMYGALTSIRLAGKTSRDDNVALQNQLREKFGILSVRRGGVAKGDCVRITTALTTTTADLDKLVAALRAIAAA